MNVVYNSKKALSIKNSILRVGLIENRCSVLPHKINKLLEV